MKLSDVIERGLTITSTGKVLDDYGNEFRYSEDGHDESVQYLDDDDYEEAERLGLIERDEEQEEDYCLLCNKLFIAGETGNELGFCAECVNSKEFPYDLDKYYDDYEKNKVAFKGFDTMSRGILENYRKIDNNKKRLK